MVLSFWLARCARRYLKRLLYAANFYLEVFSSNSHVVTTLSFRASLKRPLGAIIYTIIDRYSLLGVALNIVDRGRSRDQFLTPFLFFYAAHVCLVCPGVRRTRYVVQSYLTPCWEQHSVFFKRRKNPGSNDLALAFGLLRRCRPYVSELGILNYLCFIYSCKFVRPSAIHSTCRLINTMCRYALKFSPLLPLLNIEAHVIPVPASSTTSADHAPVACGMIL